jgi:hypothetical protein
MIKSILIKVESVSSKGIVSPLNAMLDCLNILINKYSHIGKKISDLKH